MNKKPIIGITSSFSLIQNPKEDFPFVLDYALRFFSEVIVKTGGIPLIIPISQPTLSDEYLDIIDGIIFTGGNDVGPQYYQSEPHPLIASTSPERDQMEMDLFNKAIKKNIAILGVCRGLQLINIALNGTLYQDLSLMPEHIIQHNQKTNPRYTTHQINVNAKSYLSKIYTDKTYVNSYHHQTIQKLGSGLSVSATSNDQSIEAIEWIDEQHNIIAVQWHPEMNYFENKESLQIFEDLIQRAKI